MGDQVYGRIVKYTEWTRNSELRENKKERNGFKLPFSLGLVTLSAKMFIHRVSKHGSVVD